MRKRQEKSKYPFKILFVCSSFLPAERETRDAKLLKVDVS